MKTTIPMENVRRRLAMKTRSAGRSVVLAAAVGCAGNLWGAVRPVSGALFDPSLVPTTNTVYLGPAVVANRVIVEAVKMIALEVDSILYTDVEGPTHGVCSGVDASNLYGPYLGTPPVDFADAVTNLTLKGAYNCMTSKVMFASSVTTVTDGGFFADEYGGDDDGYVYPLDSSGARIGTWQLHLLSSDYGDRGVLRPHGMQVRVRRSDGATGNNQLGGAAFRLSDFTGGSGVLNHVKGLEFVDSTPTFDLIMAGIYRGPGESVLYRAGRAAPMRNATFDQPLVNPMTNDFVLTGFAGAESIAGPSRAFQFDGVSTDSSVIWPSNGTQPTRTNALLGLEINGIANFVYWDFMFSDPVTNGVDGFFIIDQIETYETTHVFPLDADRRPISTYSIVLLPTATQWSPALINGYDVLWSGPADDISLERDHKTRIGGVVMPLSAFAGGTGGLTEAHGIRVCYQNLKLSTARLDPLVIGSYKAARLPRPVLDVETDPMPTPKLNADRISADYLRHGWTLKSITLDTGRYTDLEGPTNMIRTATDGFRAYPIDGTPPATALAAAIGLNGCISVNPGTCYWHFDTAVTNGFDGGFFFFNDNNDDSVKFEPLGANGNLIAGGFSVVINKDRDLTISPESFMGNGWKYYAVTDTNPAANTNWDTSPRGAAFTLACFTNSVGKSLTNDVHGLKLTYVVNNADVVMVGIYKGPADPPKAGVASPVKAATFTPPPVGSGPYSNDAAVASVRSDYSDSWSVKGPSSVAVIRHQSEGVFYPLNGTNPDPNPGAPYAEAYTNALLGLNMDGMVQAYVTEYMFEKPVKKQDEGFFIIESMGDDLFVVRPLAADRKPISTYSVRTDQGMMGSLGLWNIMFYGPAQSYPNGTMIRLCDFAGGTEPLGDVYGVRIEDADGGLDPMVVGQWFGPPDGTQLLLH